MTIHHLTKTNMKFKTLKSKVHNDTFGHVIDGEIYQSDIPYLQPLTAKIEGFKDFVKDYDWLIENYELIEIEILITT